MAKFVINEQFLQQVETLQILIKNNIAGLFGGNHQTRNFGSSCEFADHRDYMAGDDITKIDWNAYARFEKLYLKLFLDERQMHTRIYIDASRSMDYGGGHKAEQALKLAALIAYVSVCDMDKVSLYVIHGGTLEEVFTSVHGKDMYLQEIGKLNSIVFDGDSRISEAILPSAVGYGDGLSVIISDFLTDDNYEDAMKNTDEAARAALRSEIDKRLSAWVHPTGGLFIRYDRDRYLFLFEERYLKGFQEAKFDILDAIHDIPAAGAVPATLSIGVGKDAPGFQELFEYASLSIEMALSRGGDQAVVKNKFNFEFYGGRNKEMEKRTKVKSRVMANALAELIADSSYVFVMGHKFPDLDCIGACAGVCAIARKKGVPVRIIKEGGNNPAADMAEKLAQVPEYKEAFLSPQDAMVLADPRTLLVVVDTNRPEQVLSQDLLECCTRVAVIDHHRRAASYISNAALNFHEPYASSASELVTELLQYILEPTDLLKIEAEAVLAGIVLDTKNFTMRTGTRTFEAAAFLRRSGADTGDVKKLFQNDLAGVISRYDIIRNARMYHGDIAVTAVDHAVGRVTAAQAADELLNISGIDASFVLFPDADGERTIISARSMGNTNVQVVLEKLGGGGNAATAGAQVPDPDVNAVLQRLLRSIDQYFEED